MYTVSFEDGLQIRYKKFNTYEDAAMWMSLFWHLNPMFV